MQNQNQRTIMTEHTTASELRVGDLILGHLHSGREIPFAGGVTVVSEHPLRLANADSEIISMFVNNAHKFIRASK